MIFRYISNIYPLHGHFCNYGAFPQTWENPFKQDPWTGQFFHIFSTPIFEKQFSCTGLSGDKDPLDVCEIGFSPLPTGSVVQVSHLLVRVAWFRSAIYQSGFRNPGQPSTHQGSVVQVSHLLVRVPWFRSAIYQSGLRGSGQPSTSQGSVVQVSHLPIRVSCFRSAISQSGFRGSGQPSTNQGSVVQVSHLLVRVPWFRSVTCYMPPTHMLAVYCLTLYIYLPYFVI